MSGTNRALAIPKDEVGYYHIYNRCVRRGFLISQVSSELSNRDPRRDWIQLWLEQLCAAFAVEVCDFAIMQNHVHLILRNRPGLAASYDDEEVARRWWHTCPARRNELGFASAPRSCELSPWLLDADHLLELRDRLSDISWFMRHFSSRIAKRANQEDGCGGRFWQGRFKATRLLDEGALIACSAYVNLNPIRAGMADSLETSRYTSVFERIVAVQRLTGQRALTTIDAIQQAESAIESQLFVIPVRIGSSLWDSKSTGAKHFPSRRASDLGYSELGLIDFLALVESAGRQYRSGKVGAIPSHLAPLFQRLHISPDLWNETVTAFPRLFHTVSGRAETIEQEAARRGRRWLHGIRNSLERFP